jgi:hypothetical protein
MIEQDIEVTVVAQTEVMCDERSIHHRDTEKR